MKTGDYVRFENGTITKINSFSEKDNPLFNILINAQYYNSSDIKVSSPNIIDLIEVGDYVNGKKVIDTFTDYIFNYSEEFKVIRFSEIDILHDVKHIKSIVTHEQFERMQYNLESEVN